MGLGLHSWVRPDRCLGGQAQDPAVGAVVGVNPVRLDGPSARSQFSGFFLNALPGILDMTQRSVGLADAEAQGDAIIQPRMGEV